LQNFKRFTSFDATLDGALNILVGDNESGKSTILLALDLLLAGSRSKVETIGLESLFNSDAVSRFLSSGRKYEDLPILYVEVYLNEQNDPDFNGKNNSDDRVCDGLRLVCEPNDLLSAEIKSILEQKDPNFPFEYYEMKFSKFSGTPYAAYNRPIKHLFLDSAQISNEYATREYIKDLYNSHVEGSEKNKHQNEYRRHKEQFKTNVLSDLNDRLEKYSFAVRTTGKANLESDLTISEDGITIENKGRGQQCFIKTEFALKKPKRKSDIDILLLEEPENHLSHINMKKLIRRIWESSGRQLPEQQPPDQQPSDQQLTGQQLFIATHSNLISARLDLRRCILLNSASTEVALLNDLPNDTAEFFMKAPDNSILEFILSKKVILVEGDADYILAEAFYTKATGEKPQDSDTHVISVGGTSFKRYLDLAKILKIKTAVVRDNDGDYEQNCIARYEGYSCDHIKVFSDKDAKRDTFEICLYEDNKAICDDLFSKDRKSLSVLEYMLKNKAEAAFLLLQEKANELSPPTYTRDAIEWIRK
jgi:predicted ATP-dependent endonuclease of OLD family